MNFQLKSLLAMTGAAFVLAGCLDSDGTQDNVGTGLGLGAAAGSVIGAVIAKDDRQGAAIGGIVGAAIGGAIGTQLEKQETELRQSLGGTGAQIINTGDRLVVTLPESITFPVDSTVVKPSLQGPLRSIATSLNKYPNSIVQVVGHTDSTGSDSYNNDLSLRRAQAVSNFVLSGGVSPSRIQIIGMGKRTPVASNSTAEGRQANRRVEVNIIPTT